MLRWCLVVHPPNPPSLTFEFTLLPPLTREGSQMHTAWLQQQAYCPAPACVEILLHGCLTTNPQTPNDMSCFTWQSLLTPSLSQITNLPLLNFHPQGSVLLI